jgi:hypothetical protein
MQIYDCVFMPSLLLVGKEVCNKNYKTINQRKIKWKETLSNGVFAMKIFTA